MHLGCADRTDPGLGVGGSFGQVKVVGFADRLILSSDAVRSFAKRTMLLRHVNLLPRPAKRMPPPGFLLRRRQPWATRSLARGSSSLAHGYMLPLLRS